MKSVQSFLAISAALMVLLPTVSAFGCVGGDRCIIADPPAGAPAADSVPTDRDGDGTPDPDTIPWGYYVAKPADWDGESLIPMVVYFHGWNGSGAGVMRNPNLAAAFAERGWLFVAADGRSGTWAHQSSPAHRDAEARDEHLYVAALLTDVEARYPIDPNRRLAAGFSQGGSMVWDLACFQPGGFTAFAPIAGAYWEPLPETCEQGARLIRHIHGTDDTVVPMEGRPIGSRWHQGDLGDSLDLQLTAAICRPGSEPVRALADGTACERWFDCETPSAIDICLHDGGHIRPQGWIDATLDWIERVPPRF